MADRFQSIEKQTWWSNDETIVELGYRHDILLNLVQ